MSTELRAWKEKYFKEMPIWNFCISETTIIINLNILNSIKTQIIKKLLDRKQATGKSKFTESKGNNVKGEIINNKVPEKGLSW